ncbi:MAG TPA: restriction endonuclease [Fibrobacteres bacterium]|nr:restriction endonuclease [Fibrobacterota bacterium]
MKRTVFERSKHVYKNDAFVELVKDAVRFFNGTPVHNLPPPETFNGTGVYALYYIGKKGIYQKYGELNRLSYAYPIYVGKAVPHGWRQSRISDNPNIQSRELISRLREHAKNIISAELKASDFMCRFVIFESAGSDMISTIEAALIKIHRPLWNATLDGFGNHTPGMGRFQQAKSDWDVVHPGRLWANKCTGKHAEKGALLEKINHHFDTL